MATPDPTAAASAWLARIPQDQSVAAQAATDWQLVAWMVGALTLVGACLLLSRSGAFAGLRRAVEAGSPRPWLTSAALAGALALVLTSLNALIDAITDWRSEQILSRAGGGPSAQGLAAHLAHAGSGVAPVTVAAILIVPPLLWLIRRRPRTWPLVAGSVIAGLILLVIWLPYALSAGPALAPAPPGAVRDGLMRVIAETGVPARGVFFSPDPTFDADVTGGFGHAKVSVGPVIGTGAPAEARAFIGHIMGHYAHNDILIVCLVLGLVMLLGSFAVNSWSAPLARLIGARTVTGPGDPEALPAAAIVAILALLCAGLAEAAYLRWANVRADAYSLDHAREPDGLAAVIEREWDHQSVDPSPLEEALFYTHPAMAGRIRHAMAWKAAHGG